MSGPCHFAIFGAAGHLATTKLLPALYDLEVASRSDAALSFIALARRDWDTARWREHLRIGLSERRGQHLETGIVERFIERFEFVAGDHRDPATYGAFVETVNRRRAGTCENVVFYLAVPPDEFLEIVRLLDETGLNSALGRHRIVVEKPFGSDLASACMLNAELHRHYAEEQVYRIDHYLGKEAVQNLFVFRFANAIIEPLWNSHYIDHVQITVAESDGIGARAGYFDRAGTLRDIVQNHLFQVLALVAMEPPASLDADDLRNEKVKVLRSVRPFTAASVDGAALRGQYVSAEIDGVQVPGYREEPGVAQNSATETYAALKLHVDNWRWRGVPFYLRSGKPLKARRSQVAIRFRDAPHQLFASTPCAEVEPNWLVLGIQPEESIDLELQVREPGLDMTPRLLRIETAYRLAHERRLDAYASLLLDVIEGDRSLFIRFDEVEAAWAIVDPILQRWAGSTAVTSAYSAGSWGPEDSARLLEKPYQAWRNE
ncbi:MAG TPA: glucose-6-phosphate dehydrogenase [Gammaproteobacteria bacterium]|jgi:glucose-6-phosphate 1-dehydrogenase